MIKCEKKTLQLTVYSDLENVCMSFCLSSTNFFMKNVCNSYVYSKKKKDSHCVCTDTFKHMKRMVECERIANFSHQLSSSPYSLVPNAMFIMYENASIAVWQTLHGWTRA